MKKTLSVLALLLVVALFTGCSLVPSVKTVEKQEQPAVNFFDYSGADYAQDEILIRVVDGVDVDKLAAAYKSEVLKYWPEIGWASITVPEGKDVQSFIKQMRYESNVLLAEPNMEYKLNQSMVPDKVVGYKEQWGFMNIRAEEAWKVTTGHEKVIVAILDTGVQTNHPEFADKTILTPYDASKQKEGDIVDSDGHGTHVAGIAADNGRGGLIAGLAWDCPLLPIKVRDDKLPGSGIRTTFLIDGMIYLGQYRQKHPEYQIVANMSIGGRGYNFAFKDAIDFAADNGVLLVTSAGNDGKRLIQFPSGYNGVVSVAASDPFDRATGFSTRAWFNSIAAPGIDILSTYTGSSYEYLQGTSMASPYVTGAAALVLSAHFDKKLTPLQLKNQLEQTARKTGAPKEEVGTGILDVAAAVGELKPMAYGSLNITSDILSKEATGYVGGGIVTIYDRNHKLVAFGMTGEKGNYNVRAILPGIYTVNMSYFCAFTEKYDMQSKALTVAANQKATVNFDVKVPTEVKKTQIGETQTIGDGKVNAVNIPVKITEAGTYEFITSENIAFCDTMMILYDKDGKALAANDDAYGSNYSAIMKKLQPGDYTLEVANWDEEGAVDAFLKTFKVSVTF